MRMASGRDEVPVGMLSGFLVLWSSGSIATAIGLEHVDEWMFLLLRSLGTCVVVLLIWSRVRDGFPQNRAEWLRTVSAGVLMQFVYQAAFFAALSASIAPGLMALIIGAQPLVAALAGCPRQARVWLGIVLGFVGLALACVPDMRGSMSSLTGLGWATIALAAITTASWVQSRNRQVGHWAGLVVQSACALPLFVVIAVWQRPAWPPARIGAWAPIMWMVVVVGVGATSLLWHLVRTTSLLVVTSVQLLVPTTTAVLDLLVRSHALPWLSVMGMGVSVPAMFLLRPRPARDPGEVPRES